MRMLRDYYPYEYGESVFDIDYGKLYEKGIRGIIFDLDNTLVPHGADSNPRIDELFREIRATGFNTVLLTDNDEERVLRFIKNIDTPYVCDAEKPNPNGFLKAEEILGVKRDEIVVVGDSVFTDIKGANKMGMKSILVKYIGFYTEKKIGIKRRIEKVILKLYSGSKYKSRIGGVLKGELTVKEKKLFCEINPTCYAISERKEIIKKHIKNLTSGEKFAKTFKNEPLPVVVSEEFSHMIKKGPGIDPVLQQNKAVNIDLAAKKINGIIIRPGEVFSFWITVGKTTKSKGYLDGRVIESNKIKPGVGGGLCNLGNTIHRLILFSPLDVTEFHSHSDALAPDEGKRVPFATGTSISYNNIDYRFKNNTDRDFQILARCEGENLYAQLLCSGEVPFSYRLVEENHRFKKEGDKYFRVSKIYRETMDKKTGEVLKKELVLDNHSEVMYDYSLIPKDNIEE